MLFLGIDCGVSGGIALVKESGYVRLCEAMPSTERDLWDVIQRVLAIPGDDPIRALVEQLGDLPRRNGRALQSPASMLTMGRNYGNVRMALTAAEIPFDEILPRAWMPTFGLMRKSKEETSTAKKNRHKAKAQQLFPGVKVTHKLSDALLVAEYLRRRETGMVPDDRA